MEIFKEELQDLWDVKCPKCGSEILNKNGKYRNRQRFICLDCSFSFTTYSRSLLDSTKLSKKQWDDIILGIIHNQKLSTISNTAEVSVISVSKIRRRVLDSLYPLSRYKKVLDQYYYNPFDTSTIFIPNKVEGCMYYHQYNDEMVIVFIEYHHHLYISNAYTKREFNILISSVHYNKLKFVSSKEATNLDAVAYLENLLSYFKQYRGIKNELLAKYCNFYDFQKNLTEDELSTTIMNQISSHKQKK